MNFDREKNIRCQVKNRANIIYSSLRQTLSMMKKVQIILKKV